MATRTRWIFAVWVALFSPFLAKGQDQGAFDLAGKAPLHLLPDDATEASGIARRGGTLLVAQFNHNDRTYLAEIPTRHIARSFLAVSIFARKLIARVGHTWAAFEMESGHPVRLFEAKATAPSIELQGFVYSFNYAAKKGVEYSPLLGLLPVYQSVHNLRSPEELAEYARAMDERIGTPSTRLYEIAYDAEENREFAETLIRRGSNAQHLQTYNTLCANCSNAVFDAINDVRSHAPGIFPTCGYALSKLLVASPARSPIALYARGLVRSVYPIQTLELFAE
jgi:hypothetical protein